MSRFVLLLTTAKIQLYVLPLVFKRRLPLSAQLSQFLQGQRRPVVGLKGPTCCILVLCCAVSSVLGIQTSRRYRPLRPLPDSRLGRVCHQLTQLVCCFVQACLAKFRELNRNQLQQMKDAIIAEFKQIKDPDKGEATVCTYSRGDGLLPGALQPITRLPQPDVFTAAKHCSLAATSTPAQPDQRSHSVLQNIPRCRPACGRSTTTAAWLLFISMICC